MRRNALLQFSQANGREPSWVRLCSSSLYFLFVPKEQPSTEQENRFRSADSDTDEPFRSIHSINQPASQSANQPPRYMTRGATFSLQVQECQLLLQLLLLQCDQSRVAPSSDGGQAGGPRPVRADQPEGAPGQ